MQINSNLRKLIKEERVSSIILVFVLPFPRLRGGAKMSEFSSEDIQSAAEEVRRSNFGDFMFRDPGSNRGTSRRRTSRRNTSRRNTSRRNTSRRNTTRRVTSRRNTSRRNTSRRRCINTTEGNFLVRRCWEGSNMSFFSRTKR